jgi:hypothetical protein
VAQHLKWWTEVAGVAVHGRKTSRKHKKQGEKKLEGEGEIRKGKGGEEEGASS